MCALEVDGAVHLLHDAVDRRQTQTGSAADVLGGEERFERAAARLGVHPVAGVADFEQHVVAGRNVGHSPIVLQAIPGRSE